MSKYCQGCEVSYRDNEWEHCPVCGAALTSGCRNCGSEESPKDARFCVSCGEELPSSEEGTQAADTSIPAS